MVDNYDEELLDFNPLAEVEAALNEGRLVPIDAID